MTMEFHPEAELIRLQYFYSMSDEVKLTQNVETALTQIANWLRGGSAAEVQQTPERIRETDP